jgi:hypothetical protein
VLAVGHVPGPGTCHGRRNAAGQRGPGDTILARLAVRAIGSISGSPDLLGAMEKGRSLLVRRDRLSEPAGFPLDLLVWRLPCWLVTWPFRLDPLVFLFALWFDTCPISLPLCLLLSLAPCRFATWPSGLGPLVLVWPLSFPLDLLVWRLAFLFPTRPFGLALALLACSVPFQLPLGQRWCVTFALAKEPRCSSPQ